MQLSVRAQVDSAAGGQSFLRKARLFAPHDSAGITFHTLEFPLLISGVHKEVMILFVFLWQHARRVSMGKDVIKPVAARTTASATRPAGSVCVHQAGPAPSAQKVSSRTATSTSILQV